jgi:hypothetical protein
MNSFWIWVGSPSYWKLAAEPRTKWAPIFKEEQK